MVDVCRVIDVSAYHDGVINLENSILFPVRWFQEMFLLTNLSVTSPLMQLLDDKKMSHRNFADFLLDLQARNARPWLPYRYLITDLKTREVSGILLKDKGVNHKLGITYPKAKEPIYLDMATPYSTDNSMVVLKERMTPVLEMQYNKKMWDYFQKKYPIKLKSFSPLSGDLGTIKVAKPRAEHKF